MIARSPASSGCGTAQRTSPRPHRCSWSSIASTRAGRIYATRPLRVRRGVLEAEISSEHFVLPSWLAPNGLDAWAEVLARGYEGLVAKDPASPYVGGRTLSWLNVKVPHYREGERGWEASKN